MQEQLGIPDLFIVRLTCRKRSTCFEESQHTYTLVPVGTNQITASSREIFKIIYASFTKVEITFFYFKIDQRMVHNLPEVRKLKRKVDLNWCRVVVASACPTQTTRRLLGTLDFGGFKRRSLMSKTPCTL